MLSKLGKPCGYGQYIWKNGSTYTGEFQNGLKNGFGKYRKSKESRTNMYEGQYYRDKKQGFGIFKWASGNMYIGQYKSDEREGIGEMRWTDGSIYVGQWERGIQHGYGRMIFPDGSVKEGLFDNNVYKGPAKKSTAPIELQDANFDIMLLAPRDILFSEEIRSFYPAVRPQGETPTNQRPLRTTGDDSFEEAKRAARSLVAAPNKFRTRSFSRGLPPFIPRRPTGNPSIGGTPARSSSYTNRSKSGVGNYPRSVNSQVSTRTFRKSPRTTNRTLYEPVSRLTPLKLSRPSQKPQNQSKRTWVPSGPVHYKDTGASIRSKYFS